MGYCEIVRNLLDLGANISAVDKSRWTPMHFASREGHDDMLLNRGADINARCNRNMTPLQHVREVQHIVVETILQWATELSARNTTTNANCNALLEELEIKAGSVNWPGDVKPFLTWIASMFPPPIPADIVLNEVLAVDRIQRRLFKKKFAALSSRPQCMSWRRMVEYL